MDKISEQVIDQYIVTLGNIEVSHERLAGHKIYYIANRSDDKDQAIFAIIKQNSSPLLIDLLCDSRLAETLRQKYESVVPSKLMDERCWNRLICGGQLSQQEVFDLINLSYQLTQQKLTQMQV